ncbi:MAG: ketoacyl-ACP synthase III [Acidobacteriota bacterium]
MSLYLHGIGHYHPETEITNQFFEELDIGTNNEWIMERVGIRSRRTVLPLDYIRQTRNSDTRASNEAAVLTNAEAGAHAARMAVARAGININDIGMVVAGGVAPDTVSPAEACNIANELELEVPAFDVNSACTSHIAAMHVLAGMRPEVLPPYVLVVASERTTCSVDYNDRAGAILWGDGSIATVLSPTIPGSAVITGTRLASSPAGADKVVLPRTGLFRQEGRTVQTFAIKRTTKILREMIGEYSDAERRLHFIGHQANRGMLQSVCRLTGLPEDRHHTNVEHFGNTAAAGSPSVISQRWDSWTGGDDIAVIGVGSGLTWGGFMIRFGEEI